MKRFAIGLQTGLESPNYMNVRHNMLKQSAFLGSCKPKERGKRTPYQPASGAECGKSGAYSLKRPFNLSVRAWWEEGWKQ